MSDLRQTHTRSACGTPGAEGVVYQPLYGNPSRQVIDPITMAVHADGQATAFRTVPLTLPDRATLSPGAQQIHARIVYASGRRDAGQVIAHVTRYGSKVVAERLRVPQMRRGYVERSRALALLNHHHAALPQFLNAGGIPLCRLPCPPDTPAPSARGRASSTQATGTAVEGSSARLIGPAVLIRSRC